MTPLENYIRNYNPSQKQTVILENLIAEVIKLNNEKLVEEIEKLIQDERFSGAPYALNQVIAIINNIKQ